MFTQSICTLRASGLGNIDKFKLPQRYASGSEASTQQLQGFPLGTLKLTWFPNAQSVLWTAVTHEHRSPLQTALPFQGCLPKGISCGTAQRARPWQMSDTATVVSIEGNSGAGKARQRSLCGLGLLWGPAPP